MSKWSEVNLIVEAELSGLLKREEVSEFIIRQEGDFYFIEVLSPTGLLLALRSRRETDEPRKFKNVERLVSYVRRKFPGMRKLRLEIEPEDVKPTKPSTRTDLIAKQVAAVVPAAKEVAKVAKTAKKATKKAATPRK